ncbi:MAG: hypothetical protein IT350_00855 [Deltaproteobacteria bacterium]|nr:hypothetical protein [Deltaproteobacteria bacterium]
MQFTRLGELRPGDQIEFDARAHAYRSDKDKDRGRVTGIGLGHPTKVVVVARGEPDAATVESAKNTEEDEHDVLFDAVQRRKDKRWRDWDDGPDDPDEYNFVND